MSEDERVEVDILGKTIGTCTGWDEIDTLILVFYDFVPDEVHKDSLIEGDITVYYDKGLIRYYYDDEGGITKEIAILDLFTK